MTAKKENRLRVGALAAGGALVLTFAALGTSWWFLHWRAEAEYQVFHGRSVRCIQGNETACDLLRSGCLKRNGGACQALADAELAPGSRRDAGEAVRFLEQACEYQEREACRRAGAMFLDGIDVPKDETRARTSFDKGCELGLKEACALRDALNAH